MHARFWEQVSRWIMERPYAVRTEMVSFDVTNPRPLPGEELLFRARVLNEQGRPDESVEPVVVVRGEQGVVARIPLESGAQPGFFTGTGAGLESGAYRAVVELDGAPDRAEGLEVEVRVTRPAWGELTSWQCDALRLREMALASGGESWPEEQADAVVAALRPFRRGRMLVKELPLWQSWPWFGLLAALLSMEWILRKRGGLL